MVKTTPVTNYKPKQNKRKYIYINKEQINRIDYNFNKSKIKKTISQIAKDLDINRTTLCKHLKKYSEVWQKKIEVKGGIYIKGITENYIYYNAEKAKEALEERNHDLKQKKISKYGEDELLKEKYWETCSQNKYKISVSEGLQLLKTKNIEENLGLNLPCFKTLYNLIENDKFSHSLAFKGIIKKYRKKKARPKAKRIDITKKCILDIGFTKKQRISEHGHFEADLVVGQLRDKTCLLTITELKSKYCWIYRIPKNSESVKLTFKKWSGELKHGCKTIVLDNGVEFAQWKEIESDLAAFDTKIHFARVYNSTDKPFIENTNKMIRKIIYKSHSIDKIDALKVKEAMDYCNNKLRKSLNWKSASMVYNN